MAIFKISIKPDDYHKLEEVVTAMKEVVIMKAVEYPDDIDAFTIVFLRMENPVDLSYILLMVGGQQLRHP